MGAGSCHHPCPAWSSSRFTSTWLRPQRTKSGQLCVVSTVWWLRTAAGQLSGEGLKHLLEPQAWNVRPVYRKMYVNHVPGLNIVQRHVSGSLLPLNEEQEAEQCSRGWGSAGRAEGCFHNELGRNKGCREYPGSGAEQPGRLYETGSIQHVGKPCYQHISQGVSTVLGLGIVTMWKTAIRRAVSVKNVKIVSLILELFLSACVAESER